MSGGLGARLFVAGDVITAADVNGYLMNQAMMRFPTTAARDTAFGNGIPVGQTEGGIAGDGKPLLTEGMFAYIDSNNDVQYFNGSQWTSAPQFVLEDGAVTTIKIADDAVTGAKIADNAITSDHIAPGTVIASDIADGSITSAKILDGTIVNSDLSASASIGLSKLASGAAAQIVIANGSGIPTYTTISGDVTIDSTGNIQISADKIVNADINTSAAIELGKLADATISIQTATNYTLQLTDKNKFIKMNVTTTANTVTVPLDSSVQFPEGAQIHIIQYGTGKTQIVGATGAVIIYRTPGPFLRDRYSSATLLKCADTNVWMLMGDLSAS